MSPSQADGVIERIDEMLADDKTFNTRTGLRFMTSVMREAMNVIAEVSQSRVTTTSRLGNLENTINGFLEAQKAKNEKDEAERTKWRWALLGPTLAFAVLELIKWIFR